MTQDADEVWLLRRERGEDVSDVPARSRAGYDRLAAVLAALPGMSPRPGWKQRVLATLDAGPAPGRGVTRRRVPGVRRVLIASALAAAALIVVVIAVWKGGPEPRLPGVAREPRIEDRVSVEIRRGARPHRGGSAASIGDTLVLEVTGDRPMEVRVYGDAGEPLVRCTEIQGCSVERHGDHRRLRLELRLRAPGVVRAVLFTGAAIPTAHVELELDVEAARMAKIDTRQIALVQVQ